MKSIQLCGCLFLLAIVGVFPTKQDDHCGDVNAGDTLVFTSVIFRHGDRTPSSVYPTDPYQESYWLQWGGFGQLTQIGVQQHYRFGQWFRECYCTFLNETYSPKDVYVRSTDVDRTLRSAAAYLAAVYPPPDSQQWSDTEPLAKLWQPIPIHTVPLKDDYLLMSFLIACPYFSKLYQSAWFQSTTVNKIKAEDQSLLDYVARNAGLKVPGVINEINNAIDDGLRVELVKGLTLPQWMNGTVVEKLLQWGDLWISLVTSTDEMIRYATGQLVSNLLQLLKNKSIGRLSQKHYIYSAHDTTLLPLLAAYGTFTETRPPYASSIITELHKNADNRYFVKAFYRNDTETDPYPLNIRNCGEPCWLENYIKALTPFALEDKKAACELSNATSTTTIRATSSTTPMATKATLNSQ